MSRGAALNVNVADTRLDNVLPHLCCPAFATKTFVAPAIGILGFIIPPLETCFRSVAVLAGDDCSGDLRKPLHIQGVL